jgi:hypothetical protein
MATDDVKWTCDGVAGDAVADGLAMDAVLLGRKIERDVVSLLDAVKRRDGGMIGGVADGKGDIAKSEWTGLGLGATLAVLPGVEKKEESHDGQIGNGALTFGGG